MPLYEYRCENCGELFEAMQKFADAPLTRHEKCGGGPVDRLISVPALQFKGSGWYVNDYAKSGAPAVKETPAASSTKTDGDSGKPASSTTKPAASTSSSETKSGS